MKRPVLVAVIGYIIGIIWGLYFKISIAFLYGIIFPLIVIIKSIKKYIYKSNKKLNLYSIYRYFRYIKIYLNHKVLITLVIVSIISNLIVNIKNEKFDNLYKGIDSIELIGIINELKSENQYKNVYKIKVLKVKDYSNKANTYLYLNVDKKINLQYGDIVKVKGNFQSPSVARNYGGFNYKEYLKSLNIYGTINATNVQIIEQINKLNIDYVGNFVNKIREKIKNNSQGLLDDETYSIYLGIILGDTSELNEDVKEQFRNSNMAHILAVSGMHFSYIIVGVMFALKKSIGKNKAKIITIFILVLYTIITGFSPSVIRASIMGIMMLLSSIIHRKNDIWNSISVSLLIILIYNPFLLTNIGLQFSYLGTIGIIVFNKNVLRIINKGEKNKSKIKEIVAISISSQICILPLTIFHFNKFGIYFVLTNILLNFVLAPIIFLGFILLIFLIFNIGIAKVIAILLNNLIKTILLISNISFIPFSKIYIKTPFWLEILMFYILIFLVNFIYSSIKKQKLSQSNLRVKYVLDDIRYKFNNKTKALKQKVRLKHFAFILVFVIALSFVIRFININDLKIHFVDVGQGDCCFIETPNNKTILIDGGGSEVGSFDVGKSTLLPYILDRGYTKIDYIIVSHFDTDHIGGLLTIMEELKVGTAIISKQGEESENYKKFKEIVNNRNIKVLVVNKGDRLQIENNLYFNFLWPNNSKLVSENILNNNSIVCKLYYKNFSMLFTGDIEEIAEREILKEYNNNLDILNSTVLKVGHHGSKTSSTQEFLEAVKPKIALIGVGENNKFGHPNDVVLERLENMRKQNIPNRPNRRNINYGK